ncbi:MAG: uroporphyrinogen-III synthase [Pseudomonadota bacterium]
MTRPAAAAHGFVAGLPADVQHRITPIYSPLIDIVATQAHVDLGPDDAVIFTSANGVMHAPRGNGRLAYCIGQATTGTAQANGWRAVHRGDTAAELTESLLGSPPTAPLVLLSGVHTRGDIARTLSDAGLQARQIAVYDQILEPLTQAAQTALAAPHPILVPLFSPRTAQQFADQAQTLAHAHIIALSDAVADGIAAHAAASLSICAAPNAAAMTMAIAEALNTLLRVEGRTGEE